MKNKFLLTLFFYLFLLTAILFAQIQNPRAISGAWSGSWLNTTYQSVGAISLTISVDEENGTMSGNWVVGGTVLGMPSIDAFDTDVHFSESGIIDSLYSIYWGDINGTILFDGTIAGTAVNSPITGVGLCIGSGTFNSFECAGAFSFDYFGQQVEGEMNLTKFDPVTVPQEFNALANEDGSVLLSWNHDGVNADVFRIDRSQSGKTGFEQIAEVSGSENSYIDADVLGGATYVYRIAGANSETESDYSDTSSVVAVIVSIDGEPGTPAAYDLKQNYPNPYNPSTNFEFTLPERSGITLVVFNAAGKRVRKIKNSILTAGKYSETFNAADLASGVYFITLKAASTESEKEFSKTIKTLLLK
ncbi:MAG: T9SS type A sorting domain-containing protein [Chlorobi bacterium]|nr:T9SS type A sorting domain-containing protein [Chlorobiota bacterium]